MHYWCLLYSSVLVKKSLQNSRGGKMMLCFRLLVCLASAGSCVLGEHECGQRPRWAILMFPHSSWGKNEENTFKHTSSITIAALNTEIVCSWGANVLFVYLFLHTDWICFTHLHSRESHKWMKYSRCILFCLQGRKASSSIRVNEGRLRSHWTGFRPHRGKYDQGGKQSSRLGPQGWHLGWIQVFLEGQGRWRQIFFPLWYGALRWMAGWVRVGRIKGQTTGGDMSVGLQHSQLWGRSIKLLSSIWVTDPLFMYLCRGLNLLNSWKGNTVRCKQSSKFLEAVLKEIPNG